MCTSFERGGLRRLSRWLALPVLGAVACAAWAQAAPPGFVASPEVYKVIAQNGKFRVIEVVWQPGQKDALHSHPDSAIFYVTDCSLRLEQPGVPTRTVQPRAGMAFVQGPIDAHVVQNVGSAECRLVMFEPV